MKAQPESPSVAPHTRRGLIRQWLFVILILALLWNVGGALGYVPAAIRSLVPSSDAVPTQPPGPTETPAQVAAAGPVHAAVPDAGATAPSIPSVAAGDRRGAELRDRNTIPDSERARPAGYSVQVAAYPGIEEARTLSDQLTRAGYSVYLTTAIVNQVRFHRVRVGPFQTRQTAQQVAQRLETQGYQAPWITK